MNFQRKLFLILLTLGLAYLFASFADVHLFSPVYREAWCRDDDWKVMQASELRKRRIEDVCRNLTSNRNFKPKFSWDFFARQRPKSALYGVNHPNEMWWNNLFVSDKFKTLICEIPKSGSSNIKYYFSNLAAGQRSYNYTKAIMADIHKDVNLRKSPYLYNFDYIRTLQEAKPKYDDYFKFVFFRDPLPRLISSWRFFFSRVPQGPYVDIAIDIIRTFRPGSAGLSEAEILRGLPMLLEEFFLYLDKQNDSASFNEHWRPQTHLSNPCEIKYDFVGVADATMSTSIEYLARRLSRQPGVPKMPLGDSPTEAVDFLNLVPKDLIYRVLEKHYSQDYLMLGFPFPDLR